MGRPSGFSPELGASICARLSGGISLRRLCRQKDMPSTTSVFRWLADNPTFRDQYARAMEARGCTYGEQVIDISQRVIAGEIPPERGRVAIDALKWAAGRMAPKQYGDRVAVTGADGGAVKYQHTHELLAKATDEQLDQLERTVAQIEGVAIAVSDTSREGQTEH